MPSQREPTTAQRIGLNLRAAREHAGMSQSALADHMAGKGFPAWRQTTVSRTERGERELKMGEGRELGRLFGHGPLFRGTELAQTARRMKRGAVAREIEQRLDKIGSELDELRQAWAVYKDLPPEGED